MKEYAGGYRCFCGIRYSLLMLAVFPLLIIGLYVLTIGTAGPGNIANSSVYLIAVGCMADYFAFNGVTSKGYSFGMLKCSKRGRELVKGGIIFDQIRRFVYVVLIQAVCMMIAYVKMPDAIPSDYPLLGIVLILFVYSANTLSLFLLRNINSFPPYSLASGILTMIMGVVACVAIYHLYELGQTNLWIWLPCVAVLAVASTFAMIRYVMFNYDRSFKEEV